MSKPLAYFITFSNYGTRLHGSENGSVDRNHNRYGDDLIPPKPSLEQYEKQTQKNSPVTFEQEHRQIILETIKEVCAYRRWHPIAIHVRTNHVHVVVSSDTAPEKALHDFQAYATRHLRQAYPTLKDRKIWTRHGSTRYLWNRKKLLEVVHYVVHEQGNTGTTRRFWKNAVPCYNRRHYARFIQSTDSDGGGKTPTKQTARSMTVAALITRTGCR